MIMICLICMYVGMIYLQRTKRDYYLNMKHMRAFTDTTLAIANAWLDPEVQL